MKPKYKFQESAYNLTGIDPSNYTMTSQGLGEQFLINSINLGLGVHFISVIAGSGNYSQVTLQVRIEVDPIQSVLTAIEYPSITVALG